MPQRIADQDVKGETRFYRPPYEGISAIAWFLGAFAYLAIGRALDEGIAVVGYMALPMLGIAFYRSFQTLQNWAFKTRLTTPLPPWIPIQQVFNKQKASGQTYLGKGFEWEPYHARLMKEISTLSRRHSLDPPRIFRKVMAWLGLSASMNLEGKHYIHGCGGTENDLFVTDQSRRSHTMVLGTNGAGKTRMLEVLVTQAISRGHVSEEDQKRRADVEDQVNVLRHRLKVLYRFNRIYSKPSWFVPLFRPHLVLGYRFLRRRLSKMPKLSYGPVFILDPKGDRDLRDRAYATAKLFNRHHEFAYFSPTDEDVSFRLNPLANFTRRTELANRISALLPSGGDSDAFRQFAWRAINVVVEGLNFAGIPINLINLRSYIEGGIDKLLVQCLELHLEKYQSFYPTWKSAVTTLGGRVSSSGSLDQKQSARAAALSSFYVANVKPSVEDFPVPHPDTTIDGMIDVLTHDTQHYNKLISNLIPILVQLTTGPMEVLLSARKGESDARYPTTFQTQINSNAIVYINFESLADSVTGSALGSLFIADLTACAAHRHHQGKTEPPVSIFVDEAAEMMNDPFIQALNKGRAAGFELTLASQTISDFVSRMGNQAKALQVLGNVNTTIAMRLIDNDSIQMITEKFADTSYEQHSSSKTSTTIAAMAQRGRDFSGSVMKNSQSSDLPLVTPDLISSLPPGHFFGHLPGGRKVKGRVMLMRLDDKDRFVPSKDGVTASVYNLRGARRKLENGENDSDKVATVILDKTLHKAARRDISSVPLRIA